MQIADDLHLQFNALNNCSIATLVGVQIWPGGGPLECELMHF